jgi:hypothetical protein
VPERNSAHFIGGRLPLEVWIIRGSTGLLAEGGVGVPVAAGDLAPSDGRFGMDADEVGEDGGGQLCREFDEGSGPDRAGRDPDLFESDSETTWADRLGGEASREQPRTHARVGTLVKCADVAT